MLILGIETSCDETAVAVVRDGRVVLSDLVASQEHLHEKYGGVVPEIACRAHLETIVPLIDTALEKAGVELGQIDAVAVTNQPGLIGALLIGLTAAKTLAWIRDIPLIPIDHLAAHIYACNLSSEGVDYPAVGLVASGGHTSLLLCKSETDFEFLGGTLDDASGEAFDKVAKLLGLGYSGGPIIDRLARDGDRNAIPFPRTFLGKDSFDFSFSGLKTAVLYHCCGQNAKNQVITRRMSKRELADICASFQEAVVDVLVGKVVAAAERFRVTSVATGGGVIANSRLRERLETECRAKGLRLYMPERRFCTDNAAMVAGLAYHEFLKGGDFRDLRIDAFPSGSAYG